MLCGDCEEAMPECLKLETLRVEWLRPDIAQLVLDMPGKSANIITAGLQDDLERALDHLTPMSRVRGVIMTSAKEKIFVAGADLTAIVKTLDWSDEQIVEFCHRGQRLYNRFQELPFVSVAAVHGACVGGGLELALGCHFVVAANDRRTLLGLPETKLGLIPGWAGTVRLPRLVGIDSAIELITRSELFDASRAASLGIITAAVDREQLIAQATEIIDRDDSLALGMANRQRQHAALKLEGDFSEHLKSWYARVDANRSIYSFATRVLAKSMLENTTVPFEAACEIEARAMAEVYGSEPSRGLLNQFFLNEYSRKFPAIPSEFTPHPMKRVAVIGAGVMGRSIAREFLKGQLAVTVVEPESSMRELALRELRSPELTVLESMQQLNDVDLVIECITENLQEKRRLWSDLATILPDDVIFASNTSACSIQEIFANVPSPSRCCGIHYCHPQLMQLVEVVRTNETSEETVTSAVSMLRAQRKTPIVVRDTPGFVVNRILTAMLDSAIHLFETGTPFPRVDDALRAFGFPAGPFEIMDVIGLDTVVHAGRAMIERRACQVSRSPILPRLVRRNHLGRKSLTGFYRYDVVDGPTLPGKETDEILTGYQTGSSERSPESIAQFVLVAMLLAAGEVIDRETVDAPKSIDLAMIQGLGFPAHHGGLLFWASRQSPSALEPDIQTESHRARMTVPKSIQHWLSHDGDFYQTLEE
jgi:3-hydroxyacyl-CoA dehydrogenase/enoyl-CoA hydratase/3-hydroxybutyryl-CoA epimerase/3-hydroxyacyl-CoA dehydrogenase/enoyl-CoA hydratase/3-hydroxybutyryl-CoA epimerase/enoyl-CoA isomerase